MNETLPECPRCGAMGTSVEMGICCKVKVWDRQYSVSERFWPLPHSTRPYTWRPGDDRP